MIPLHICAKVADRPGIEAIVCEPGSSRAAEHFEGAAVLSRLRSLKENTWGLRGIAGPL